jgi:HAD superfamily hydrolase (TIGR01509 family)
MNRGVLFDVDGTLVDTNYLHAVAWAEAFRSQGYEVATAGLHSLIGQGSERLVTSVLGHEDQAVVDAHADFYAPHLHHLVAFPAAGDLLRKLSASDVCVVLATSADERDAKFFLDAIDAHEAVAAVVTKDDVDASKPDPDLVDAALNAAKLDPADAIFVGDTVWDVEAAARAGLSCVCVLTGGIDERELRAAGAVEIYRDVGELSGRLADSAIGKLLSG